MTVLRKLLCRFGLHDWDPWYRDCVMGITHVELRCRRCPEVRPLKTL